MDSNIPKFVNDDLPLFHAIIKDLYPNLELPAVEYETLIEAIETVQSREGLTPNDAMTSKVI